MILFYRRIIAVLLSLFILFNTSGISVIATDDSSDIPTNDETSISTSEDEIVPNETTTMGTTAVAVSRTSSLNLTSTVTYQKSGGGTATFNPTTTNSPVDNAEGWSWSYATKTLTLNGVDINVTGVIVYGIQLPAASTITLAANSTNKIVSTYHGTYGHGALTVNGSGYLQILANRNGLYNAGALNIDGVENLHITDCWYGIFAKSVTITNSDIIITSNYDGAIGIYTDNVTISGTTDLAVTLTNGSSNGIIGTGGYYAISNIIIKDYAVLNITTNYNGFNFATLVDGAISVLDNAKVNVKQIGSGVNSNNIGIQGNYINISGNAEVDVLMACSIDSARSCEGIRANRALTIMENANVTITTTGAYNPTSSGMGALGIRATGTMNISTTRKVKVTTSGKYAHGIYLKGSVDYGGDLNITGNGEIEIVTAGVGAYGIYCDTMIVPVAKVVIAGSNKTSVSSVTSAFYAAPVLENYMAVQSGGWNTSAVVYVKQDSGKISLTINETGKIFLYDQGAKIFTVLSTPEKSDFVVTYKQSGVVVAAPTNVGSYDVTITRAEDDIYNAFSRYIAAGLVIVRLTLDERAQTVTYDNTGKAFALREVFPVGSNSFAIAYSQNGNAVLTPTALGSYNVHILWTGTGGAYVYEKTLLNGLTITNTVSGVTIYEDFDSLGAFAINPTNSNGWSYICGDGSNETYRVPGYVYANLGAEAAYITFNVTQTTPSAASDPKLTPHSGNQFLACFSETGASVYGNDFFITPLINAGSDIRFGFWARGYDGHPYYFGARFKVRYSTTGKAIGDFTNYVAGVAGNNIGQYILTNNEWTYYEYFIPKAAKYVTINCTSTFFH